MKEALMSAILAAIANEKAAELEFLKSDMSVTDTAAALEAAVASCGGQVLNRFGDSRSFVPSDWEIVLFRARGSDPSGAIRRAPALEARVEREDDGIWIRFGLAERRPAMPHAENDLPRAA